MTVSNNKQTGQVSAARQVITRRPGQGKHFLIHICLTTFFLTLLVGCAGENGQHKTPEMNDNKKAVHQWYNAFSRKDAALLDSLLDEEWMDIPAPAEQLHGSAGGRQLLQALNTIFPDLKLTVKEVLQEGNKVVVRAEMSGTQQGSFVGHSPRGRKLAIQVIDIHEFRNGKIIRTWHSEDWMTGLHQLGILQH